MYFPFFFYFIAHNCATIIIKKSVIYGCVCNTVTIKCEKFKLTSRVIFFKEEHSEGRVLEPQFSKHQVLIDLGLTQVEARVYLTLVKSGPSRISAISKTSKVARPEIYRNLSKLQELGLVEKIIKRPLEYRAIPIDEGVSLLLKTKTNQYKRVRAESRLLLNTAKRDRAKIEKENIETPQFVLIPEGRAINRINTAIEKAQLSIDLVVSWKRFSRGMVSTFAESVENAWSRKVKTRFIVESPAKSKTAKQLIQFCREKPFCQIRFIPSYPETIFGIYDKKEIFVVVRSKTDLPDSPDLWSNNRNLIALAECHFEILWLTAMEEPKFNQQKSS
jgi:sugar-specific transcriptional regulator TrmB